MSLLVKCPNIALERLYRPTPHVMGPVGYTPTYGTLGERVKKN